MWCVFLELLKMQCACVTLEGTPEPALHIPRWSMEQSVKWFAFLDKRPQRGRDGHVQTRSEPYDETCKYSQPANQLHIKVPSHNSIAITAIALDTLTWRGEPDKKVLPPIIYFSPHVIIKKWWIKIRQKEVIKIQWNIQNSKFHKN